MRKLQNLSKWDVFREKRDHARNVLHARKEQQLRLTLLVKMIRIRTVMKQVEQTYQDYKTHVKQQAKIQIGKLKVMMLLKGNITKRYGPKAGRGPLEHRLLT